MADASQKPAAGGESAPRTLLLETGFHTATINRIDVAADGTVLTVSDDKTARLWQREGKGFRLERVLRVPRGP
ncbi:MAG: WD40 repeat domain-containing protein, partial [Planctomycetota bacterium]|nr:WD40 repeat domain-containing protein [Planctomycetota bacterium]